MRTTLCPLLPLRTHLTTENHSHDSNAKGRKLVQELLLIFLTLEPNIVYLIASPNVVLILETSLILFKLGGYRKLIHILHFDL